MSYRAWMSETQRRSAVMRLLFPPDDWATVRAAQREVLYRRAQKQRELDERRAA